MAGMCPPGAPRLRYAVPLTAVEDLAFHPCPYWRGSTWPVTWLLWWALDRDGCHDGADALRAAAVDTSETVDMT